MTRNQMRQTIFEYIEVDYNRTRRHSALGYLNPVNFEQQMSLNAVSSLAGADHCIKLSIRGRYYT